jgi:rubrerythrin
MPEDALLRVEKGLVQAMRAEHFGRYFYMMAAKSTSDPKGREVFARLAEEEKTHFDYLKKQYAAVSETGTGDGNLKLGAQFPLDGNSPIFSDRLRSRIKDAHYEMTALSVGIQLELDAQSYYRNQAAETDDIVVKTFYLELAEWEAGHYRALLNQQETLKEDYWEKGGFAPF